MRKECLFALKFFFKYKFAQHLYIMILDYCVVRGNAVDIALLYLLFNAVKLLFAIIIVGSYPLLAFTHE